MISQDNYYRFVRIITKLSDSNLQELKELIEFEEDMRDLNNDDSLFYDEDIEDYEMYE